MMTVDARYMSRSGSGYKHRYHLCGIQRRHRRGRTYRPTAIVIGVLFLVSLPRTLAGMIPSQATAPALIIEGVTMLPGRD